MATTRTAELPGQPRRDVDRASLELVAELGHELGQERLDCFIFFAPRLRFELSSSTRPEWWSGLPARTLSDALEKPTFHTFQDWNGTVRLGCRPTSLDPSTGPTVRTRVELF
jgi:hypothetical protein